MFGATDWWSKWAEVYFEPCQTSKMELFANIVNGFQPLTVFANSYILDVWQGSEYALGQRQTFKPKRLFDLKDPSSFTFSSKLHNSRLCGNLKTTGCLLPCDYNCGFFYFASIWLILALDNQDKMDSVIRQIENIGSRRS